MGPRSIVGHRLSRRIGEREATLSRFLEAEQERIAGAGCAMARAFRRGGTLLTLGADAAQVAVQFMHPGIEGRCVLPALALGSTTGGAERLAMLARPDDIALGLFQTDAREDVEAFLEEAHRRGLVTIAFGADTAEDPVSDAIDYAFIVPSSDPFVVQEVQKTTYHALWELVHVLLGLPGLVDDPAMTFDDATFSAQVLALSNGVATIDRDGFLEEIAVEEIEDAAVGDLLLCESGVAVQRLGYEPARSLARSDSPDRANHVPPTLVSEGRYRERIRDVLRSSTLSTAAEATALRRTIDLPALERCAHAMRIRLDRGGRVISFGNGVASADAQDAAADFAGRGWPAIALTTDPATITAIGSDVGFDKVFARQLAGLARPQDIALGIAAGGVSSSVVAALREARGRELLSCVIVGDDGGHLAGLDWLDHLLVVRNNQIPRHQELHATIYHLLVEAIGAATCPQSDERQLSVTSTLR